MLGQSRPESDGNEGILRIPGALLSDCLVSYTGHSLWGGVPHCRETDWADRRRNFIDQIFQSQRRPKRR